MNGNNNAKESISDVFLVLVLIVGLVAFLLIGLGEEFGEPEISSPVEPILRMIVGWLASLAEAAAAIVIAYAIIRSLLLFTIGTFRQVEDRNDMIKSVQLTLGRTLALGLEFMIAGDIVRTAVAPTQHQILRLAAIVVLRTLINYFLEHEMLQVENEFRMRDL
jgi:uncharacterized membrane protein